MPNPLAALVRLGRPVLDAARPASWSRWRSDGTHRDPGHGSPGPVRLPQISVCGIDPRVDERPVLSTVHLAPVPHSGSSPRTVSELLAGRTGDFTLRRLSVDLRHLRGILDDRGGRTLLAALVRDPADRVTNAVFRAAIGEPARHDADGGSDAGPRGEIECAVRIGDEGDTESGRCRLELGRARLTLLTLLTDSECATRGLAEALARPRDREVRHRLERSLAERVADRPLPELLGPPLVGAAPAPERGAGAGADLAI